MDIITKRFDELTSRELYEILRTRSEIFVVEQNCPYQDLDGRDYESIHVFMTEAGGDGRVIACLRSFMLDSETAQIGRVVTLRHREGLGSKLLAAGIAQVRALQHPKRILIEAQCYAAGFYAREGFRVCSEEFLEDGIPHVRMLLDLAPQSTADDG